MAIVRRMFAYIDLNGTLCVVSLRNTLENVETVLATAEAYQHHVLLIRATETYFQGISKRHLSPSVGQFSYNEFKVPLQVH